MIVRPFRLSDADTVVGWFKTAREVATWGSPARRFPLDTVEIAGFFAETGGERPAKRMWIGEDANGHAAATATTFLNWDQAIARMALIGVDPACRGQGLALPFLRDVVDATMDSAPFARLELNVYTFNEPAIRTYERLGFVREGVHRSSARFGSERWDTAHMAMLRDEWEAERAGRSIASTR
ncbi:GNAT family N-acetyltransferase [Pararhizobium mangrovi]|uniref:GNAT family N-acetyltransferase n=1 Tax=Pararhizobium mangrovi TaxID=2590452 RepID=A0A506U042_9HYPH|nr:GNAT family protein [Pararhizobium mangrovi]TPW27140.1 GNAT family N-acetyltransferase [Pararhizobium mangrovi]